MSIQNNTPNETVIKQLNVFETMFNSSNDVLIFFDLNKTVIKCNDTLLKNFYVDKNELIGKNLEWLLRKKIYNQERFNLIWGNLNKAIITVIKTREPYQYSEKFYVDNGESKYLNILISPVFHQIEFIGLILTGRDITKETNLSIALEEKQEQLSNILERLPICAFLKYRNNEVILGSLALKNVINEDMKKMHELSLVDIFSKEYLKIVEKEDDEIYKTKQPIDIERLVKFSKKDVWCRIRKTPIFTPEGKVKAIVVMYEDITSQRECTNQRDFFIKTLIHDLKVPTLAQLRGIELLRNETLGDINNNQKEILDDIIVSCNCVLEMIAIILTTYRLDNNEITLLKSKFSITKMIQSCVNNLKNSNSNLPNIQIESIEDNLFIIGDENLFKLAIQQIINKILYKFNYPEIIKIKIVKENNNDISIYFQLDNIEIEKLIPVTEILNNFKFSTIGYGVDLFLSNRIISLHNGKIYASLSDTIINSIKIEIPSTV